MDTLPSRIGFIGTHFTGQDGAERQTLIWAELLAAAGHECFYFAGRTDHGQERSVVVPEASGDHPDIAALHTEIFDTRSRSSKTSGMVQAIRFHLKQHLYQFIKTFDINLLIVENALSLPLNLPLGLALSELVAETELPTIAHHHEFYWWHARYVNSAAGDYLRAAFPPALPSLYHVVLNGSAARQLALRVGSNAIIIPPALDFDHPPQATEEDEHLLRQAFGVDRERPVILQPSAALPGARSELGIEAAAGLNPGSVYLVQTGSPLETAAHREHLVRQAVVNGMEIAFAADKFGSPSPQAVGDEAQLNPAAAYRAARWVSYPVSTEYCDSAFLGAILHRRPLLMTQSSFTASDLSAQGMQVITIEETLNASSLDQARETLADQEASEQMADMNFVLGRRHYHIEALQPQLDMLLNRCIRAIR
jgi:hypothetical protein